MYFIAVFWIIFSKPNSFFHCFEMIKHAWTLEQNKNFQLRENQFMTDLRDGYGNVFFDFWKNWQIFQNF